MNESYRDTFGRGIQQASSTPGAWILGLVLAFIGWNSLPLAITSTLTRSSDSPIGRGVLGILILIGFIFIALIIEVALTRVLAANDSSLAEALQYGVRRFVTLAGLVVAIIITTVIFDLVVALPLYSFFGTAAGVILGLILPLVISLSVILFSALSGLALVLPVLACLPLSLRGIALRDSGASRSVMDSLEIIENRFGAIVLTIVISLALDVVLFAIGIAIHARDVSLLSLLGVISEWDGASVPMGVVLIIVGAATSAFKVALWTSVYQSSSSTLEKSGPTVDEQAAFTDATRRSLTMAFAYIRSALKTAVGSSHVLLLAAVIAFAGALGPVDLLVIYHLFPSPDITANLAVTSNVLSSTVLFIWVPLAIIISAYCSTALILATDRANEGTPIDLMDILALALRKLLPVLGALLMLGIAMLVGGGFVLVAVLFSMALLVQAAPGLDAVATAVETIIAVLVLLAGAMLIPFVTRAAVLDDTPPRDALERASDVAFMHRPGVMILLFLLASGLDVLKGPLASLVGLVTNGWTDVLAIVFAGKVDPPLTLAAVGASLLLFILATLIVAFKATLWTRFYRNRTFNAKGADFPQRPASRRLKRN